MKWKLLILSSWIEAFVLAVDFSLSTSAYVVRLDSSPYIHITWIAHSLNFCKIIYWKESATHYTFACRNVYAWHSPKNTKNVRFLLTFFAFWVSAKHISDNTKLFLILKQAFIIYMLRYQTPNQEETVLGGRFSCW